MLAGAGHALYQLPREVVLRRHRAAGRGRQYVRLRDAHLRQAVGLPVLTAGLLLLRDGVLPVGRDWLLLVHGGGQPDVVDRTKERAERPRTRLEIFLGRGHWVHDEDPVGVGAAIGGFLASLGVRPGSRPATGA